MSEVPLLVERSPEGYAMLTLNRPDRLNTLTIAMRRSLADAIDELEADPQIHALILTGAGRVFTAGLSLDEWDSPGLPSAGAYEHDPVAALKRFSGPVIGAINGLALTGGVEIALACDVLIAADDARFADTHVHVGLLPGWGGSARMIQRVGLARAKELAFTGRFFSADEALAWGFVSRIVPSGRLLDEARAFARQMLTGVPEALVAYKRLLDQEAATTFDDALRIERSASMANNTRVPRDVIDTRLSKLKGRKA